MRSAIPSLLGFCLLGGCCCERTRCCDPRTTFVVTAAPCAPPVDRSAGLRLDVPIVLGESDLGGDDKITIIAVRGDRERFEEGGTYCVSGTYALRSVPSAELMLWSTNGGTEATVEERSARATGSGSFSFRFKITADGYLHVSFYPVEGGAGLGGVYFQSPTSPGASILERARAKDIGPVVLSNQSDRPQSYMVTLSVLDADGLVIKTVALALTLDPGERKTLKGAEWGGRGIGEYKVASLEPTNR